MLYQHLLLFYFRFSDFVVQLERTSSIFISQYEYYGLGKYRLILYIWPLILLVLLFIITLLVLVHENAINLFSIKIFNLICS